MIPKIIHFFWHQGESLLPDKNYEVVQAWREMNPGYSVVVHDNKSVSQLIRSRYPKFRDLYMSLDSDMEPDENKARYLRQKQCDLARLFIIHQNGGIYLDCDLVPKSSLDEFFRDPWIYNRYLRGSKIPDFPSKCSANKDAVDCILSSEHCAIDHVGRGVANGVILAKPGQDWILEFIEEQRGCSGGLVLDFVGTWAFTRFVRARVKNFSGKVMLLPPHYFLFEPKSFSYPTPPYCISEHPAENTWGDPSKEAWWMV